MKHARVSRRDAAVPEIVVETIELLSFLLARTGLSPSVLVRLVREAADRVPSSVVREGRRAAREMMDASHVLTLWFSDPDYLDQRAVPIPLRVRGPAPSLATLIRRIDPALDVTEVVRYLLKARALRRVGRSYVPRGRTIQMRGTAAPVHERNLRPLRGMLRTLEHNSRPRHEGRSWLELLAENPLVPVSALARLDAQFDRLGGELARRWDAAMHLAERRRRPGEPTVRLGIGVYRFESEPHRADKPVPIGRTAQKSKRRKKRKQR